MPKSKELHILWTNGDILTSRLMVLKYSTKGMTSQWWDKITVILWGAPVKLAAENETIRECLKMAQHVGVEFSACIDCALQFDVVDELKALGVESLPWGEKLSQIVQNSEPFISV